MQSCASRPSRGHECSRPPTPERTRATSTSCARMLHLDGHRARAGLRVGARATHPPRSGRARLGRRRRHFAGPHRHSVICGARAGGTVVAQSATHRRLHARRTTVPRGARVPVRPDVPASRAHRRRSCGSFGFAAAVAIDAGAHPVAGRERVCESAPGGGARLAQPGDMAGNRHPADHGTTSARRATGLRAAMRRNSTRCTGAIRSGSARCGWSRGWSAACPSMPPTGATIWWRW